MRSYLKTGIIILGVLIAFGIIFSLFGKAEYDEPAVPRPTLGNPNASIVVEEFSDLQCPACAASHPYVKDILLRHGDDIYFKHRHFPLQSIHFNAHKAAQASECANDQGVFFPFVDAAYNNQHRLNKGGLMDLAGLLELDRTLFGDCLDSGVKAFTVDRDLSEGLARGVAGTPTFFVNGAIVEGGVENLEAEILSRLDTQ